MTATSWPLSSRVPRPHRWVPSLCPENGGWVHAVRVAGGDDVVVGHQHRRTRSGVRAGARPAVQQRLAVDAFEVQAGVDGGIQPGQRGDEALELAGVHLAGSPGGHGAEPHQFGQGGGGAADGPRGGGLHARKSTAGQRPGARRRRRDSPEGKRDTLGTWRIRILTPRTSEPRTAWRTSPPSTSRTGGSGPLRSTPTCARSRQRIRPRHIRTGARSGTGCSAPTPRRRSRRPPSPPSAG